MISTVHQEDLGELHLLHPPMGQGWILAAPGALCIVDTDLDILCIFL